MITSFKILLSSFLSLTALPFINFSTQEKSKNFKFDQMYVLGDSLSDCGSLTGAVSDFLNNNWEIDTKKIEFSQVYYKQKEFCTGPVAVQHLAEKLGLFLSPGWNFSLDNTFGGIYDHFGNNYAVGGSQAGPSSDLASQLVLDHFNLTNQCQSLLIQHGNLNQNDLVVIEDGNNDLFNALSLNNPSAFDITVEQKKVADKAISAEQQTITNLIAHGAKHILVSNIPNLSKTPKYLIKKHLIAEKLVNYYNQQWNNMINLAQKQNSNIIKKFNLNKLFDNKLQEAQTKNMDILHATVNCDFSGSGMLKAIFTNDGKINVKFVNNKTKNDLANDFFLDYIHPTEWMQNEVGNEMYKQVVNW